MVGPSSTLPDRLNEVHRLADRITILRDGSVVAQYLAGQVSDDRLIRDRQGAAILLISSDLQELIHLSHRIYVMHRGRDRKSTRLNSSH